MSPLDPDRKIDRSDEWNQHVAANEARDERLRNEGRLDERARVLDVDALAPAYHRVGCILGKSVAFHSCKYRDAHRRTMASLVALLAGARP